MLVSYNHLHMSITTEKDHPGRPVRRTPPPVERALRAIGEDVAVWRKLRGLTQVQVADRAGVSPSTLRRLESADGGITLENLLRILRALGVLESLPRALDPYETDIGRLRSEERLPRRVRPKNLTGRGDGRD
jgi:transcriptional regulator with XRE-family HTH domain